MVIKSRLKNIAVCVAKNGCGHSGHRTVKSVLCHDDTNLGKLKINNYWVGMVKNELLNHGTLASAISKK